MFTKNDVQTIEQILTLISKGTVDKLDGKLSNNRKVTAYRIKLQNTIRLDIRGE